MYDTIVGCITVLAREGGTGLVASSSSARVGDMVGVMFLRLELRELDNLLMKRLARLLLCGVFADSPVDGRSSPEPLSVIPPGDIGVDGTGETRSRSLLVEDRRLEMLKRRAKLPVFVWVDGGRVGDRTPAELMDTGDAKWRLSVDRSELRRSLMKSLTMDSDDLRRGRCSFSSFSSGFEALLDD